MCRKIFFLKNKQEEKKSNGVVARLGAVLREDMDAEGAKTVSLRRVDTDKGDVDRPNYRSRLGVREIKKAIQGSAVPSAAELFSVMPLLVV